MTDELTPEQLEALKGLPKERMPSAGLEDRVVGALRERDVLSKPHRRTIVITNSRVAGLLAASVAVVIGAYSMGVYWGGGADRITSDVTPISRDDGPRANETVIDVPEMKSEQSASDEAVLQEGRAVSDAGHAKTKSGAAPDRKADTPEEGLVMKDRDIAAAQEEKTVRPNTVSSRQELVEADAVAPPPAASPPPTTSSTEEAAQLRETLAQKESTPATLSTKEETSLSIPEAQAMLNKSANPTQSSPQKFAARSRSDATTETLGMTGRSLTFLLDGRRVVVEAPDSVRVTQDDRGRMLIIYTSDGIIRIHLADDE